MVENEAKLKDETKLKARVIRHVGVGVLGIHIIGLGIGMYGLKFRDGFSVKSAQKPEQIIDKKIYAMTKDIHIANTLAKSRYPKILTAISKVESDFRPQVYGDSGDSYGLFQLQEKHWGPIGESVEEQTRAAERVVGVLIERHGFPKCIERYNGRGQRAREYRKRVLAVMAKL